MNAAREGRAARPTAAPKSSHTSAPPRSLTAALAAAALLLVPVDAVARQDAFSLEGLVVTASPTARAEEAVASHVTILSGDDLRAAGAGSLGEALRTVAGLHVVRGGSFGAVTSLFTRGAESDHTLVLVDGIQVNQAGGGFDLSDLDLRNVERVEVLRGPASALYGSDAVAGVVHVITRTGRGAPRVTVGVDAGSFGSLDRSASFQAGTDRAGYSVVLGRSDTDGVLAFNNGARRTTLAGTARLRPDDRTSLSVGVRLSDREYHYPTDGSGELVDRNAHTFTDATTAHVEVTRGLGASTWLDARLGLHETDGGTDDAQDGPADTLGFFGFQSLDHFRRGSAEIRLHRRLGGAVLTGGVEYETERQRSFTESASEFGASTGRSEHERDNLGWVVHGAGTAGSVSYQLGARLEDNERYGRYGTWNVGATWRLPVEQGTVVRVAAGRAIKEPTFVETFSTGFSVGNPDLGPERSRSWEVGVEQPVVEGLVLRATYFDQRLRDLIQYTFTTPSPGDPNFYNVASAGSRGLEVDAEWSRERLVAGGTWSWLHTEVLDAGFDTGAGATFVEGEALLRRPRHTASLRGGYRGERLSLDATIGFVGARSDRDFTTFPATPVVLDDYRTLSLDVAWAPVGSGAASGLTLRLRAENLMDASYEEVFGFAAPGRGVYAGASFSF